jgi:dTDP-4-amino-4,6-dideoxygalactose transaminase
MVGREREYLNQVLEQSHLSGDGPFTKKCHAWFGKNIGGHGLLTHSCTGALEMACLLANLQPGDEVILPSYTFVSTANAVALRGAVPVFVDVREDTLNIDETLIEDAITDKTKAIIAVHYAGVVAEMDAINAIAARYGLFVIEDAAQALFSTYKGRQAGTLSDAAAFSFHETKNVLSGEGGALVVRDEALFHRGEILREKGTNRSSFFRGAVDKYSWVDLGSSYLPGELVAAFLYAQLEQAADVTAYRRSVCDTYRSAFGDLAVAGRVRLPQWPDHCTPNGHMFYLLLGDLEERTAFIAAMKDNGIITPFHYVPLHSAPAGRKLARAHGPMTHTDALSDRLVRLPVYYGVKEDQGQVIDVALKALG